MHDLRLLSQQRGDSPRSAETYRWLRITTLRITLLSRVQANVSPRRRTSAYRFQAGRRIISSDPRETGSRTCSYVLPPGMGVGESSISKLCNWKSSTAAGIRPARPHGNCECTESAAVSRIYFVSFQPGREQVQSAIPGIYVSMIYDSAGSNPLLKPCRDSVDLLNPFHRYPADTRLFERGRRIRSRGARGS